MTHKEDWLTGSSAAALGGVTTVFDMPNTVPPVDTVAHFQMKAEQAAAKSVVDYGIYGLLGEHKLDQLELLADVGVCGFKLFLATRPVICPVRMTGLCSRGSRSSPALACVVPSMRKNSPIPLSPPEPAQGSGAE